MVFFTVWIAWYEEYVFSVLQEKDKLRNYYSFSGLKARVQNSMGRMGFRSPNYIYTRRVTINIYSLGIYASWDRLLS